MRRRSRDRRRSVDRGTRRPAIELRNQPLRGADAVIRSGRPHRRRRYWQAARGPRAVRDPVHAWTLVARETGGPTGTRRRWYGGSAGEGHKPQSRHVRLWEVGRPRSTWEAAEQGRAPVAHGGGGGKAVD